ncbi:MAG: hypothetical protein WC736_15575 [Gallionella sp.]|jgi:hypothetical protein
MTPDERKAWEEIVSTARWAHEIARNEHEVPENQKAILAADAALKEAEGQLCRIKEQFKIACRWIVGGYGPEDIECAMHSINAIQEISPCRHEAEAGRLREAVRWAHAPVNVFAFQPEARDMFLAELDRRATLPEEEG